VNGADSEWRRRWHYKLGRIGAEPEGKLYERLAIIMRERVEAIARAESAEAQVDAIRKINVAMLAALKQMRDFYHNADSAWRFSEGFDIDTVYRVIAKADGEPYPPFEGTDVMDGDEDRT
jgi:hypothetical protein